MMPWRTVALLAALATLAACGKDKEVDPPAELVEINQSLPLKKLWSTGVGGGGEKLRLGLGVAEQAGVVYAASRDARIAKQVAEKTQGRVEIQVYPASQLGSSKDQIEAVALGTQQMVTDKGRRISASGCPASPSWRRPTFGEMMRISARSCRGPSGRT